MAPALEHELYYSCRSPESIRDALHPETMFNVWGQQQDELAQAVLPVLDANKISGKDTIAAIQQLARDGEPSCAAFIERVSVVPDWIDFSLVEEGQKLVQRRPIALVLGYFVGTLTSSYYFGSAAQTMAATGRFEADAKRRVMESTGFVHDIFALPANSLLPGGKGWETVLRVRLLHARVGKHFSKVLGDSRPPEWGLPLNDFEQVMSRVLHVVGNIEAAERLGARLSDREREAFFGFWRYISFLLAAPDELQTLTYAEEKKLWDIGLFASADSACPWATPMRGATEIALTQLIPGVPVQLPRALVWAGLEPKLNHDYPFRPSKVWLFGLKAVLALGMCWSNYFQPRTSFLDPLRMRFGRRLLHAATQAGYDRQTRKKLNAVTSNRGQIHQYDMKISTT